MASRPTPKLFGIPQELRDMIWEYALTSPTTVDIEASGKLALPALLLVDDKRTQEETRPIFYSKNEFRVVLAPYSSIAPLAWAINIAASDRKKIRKLVFELRPAQHNMSVLGLIYAAPAIAGPFETMTLRMKLRSTFIGFGDETCRTVESLLYMGVPLSTMRAHAVTDPSFVDIQPLLDWGADRVNWYFTMCALEAERWNGR